MWERTQQRRVSIGQVVLNGAVLRRFVYLVVVMTAFNVMRHGTQDLHPTFLPEQHHASAALAVGIAVLYNIGALPGGLVGGTLSERIGRRRLVVCALVGLAVVPLFAFAPSLGLLTVGAVLLQFLVQGAWSVIPAHLSELSPDEIRGFYPGVTYQAGNLCAAINLPLQASIAASSGHDDGKGLAYVTVSVLLAVALIMAVGPENRGAEFGCLAGPRRRVREAAFEVVREPGHQAR